jgi:hypothetical protein
VTVARKLRVASVQMEHQDGDRDTNFTKIEAFVAQATAQGAQLVADLDASLLETATGRRWIRARRPELYGPLTVRTRRERDTRELKFR